MGQTENGRRVSEGEARAFAKSIKTSPQKLNLIAKTIRGKTAERALVDLEFSKRRAAEDVRKLLQSAVANAENNHGLDVDSLIISEAYVGKALQLKRFRARAKGRGARIFKTSSNMTIVVKQKVED
jgi:large subunit ribosomal protein L22